MWGSKPDPKKQLREQKRVLKKEERGVGREVRDLERKEAKLVADIKRSYKTGDKRGAELQAKQLVQLRKTKTRLMGMSSKISGISANATAMGAQVTMSNTIASTSKVMGKMNDQMDVHKLQGIMQGFEKQNMQMDMKSELMDDALDGIFDDDEAEADDVVNSVLDELGIEMGSALQGVKVPDKAPQTTKVNEVDDDLIRRLAALND